MKEISDATIEELSSIALSFYEESDESNQWHGQDHRNHNQHSTTTNKSVDSQNGRQEVRYNDTRATMATSDSNHDFFS